MTSPEYLHMIKTVVNMSFRRASKEYTQIEYKHPPKTKHGFEDD